MAFAATSSFTGAAVQAKAVKAAASRSQLAVKADLYPGTPRSWRARATPAAHPKASHATRAPPRAEHTRPRRPATRETGHHPSFRVTGGRIAQLGARGRLWPRENVNVPAARSRFSLGLAHVPRMPSGYGAPRRPVGDSMPGVSMGYMKAARSRLGARSRRGRGAARRAARASYPHIHSA